MDPHAERKIRRTNAGKTRKSSLFSHHHSHFLFTFVLIIQISCYTTVRNNIMFMHTSQRHRSVVKDNERKKCLIDSKVFVVPSGLPLRRRARYIKKLVTRPRLSHISAGYVQ